MSTEPLVLASPVGAKASNLALGLRCLPRHRRNDAFVFYSFCRAVDDIADDPLLMPSDKRWVLDHWKSALKGDMELPLPPAMAELIDRRSLDRKLLVEIVRGCAMDVEPQRIATFPELQAYCWKVACAVGLVSVDIFGCQDLQSKVYAEHLGHALQLTNILRDVAEDAWMGRIYLPLEDLERFQVTEESLLAGQPDGDFAGLMSFEADRAESFYQAAKNSLPKRDRRALLPARIMHAVYHKILLRMRADGFQVFQTRYGLSRLEKILLFIRIAGFSRS